MTTWDVTHPKLRGRTAARPAVADRLAGEHPWLSREYLTFLREVGYGDLEPVVMYEAAIPASELSIAAAPPGFLVIGDDRAGEVYGFTPEDPETVMAFDTADPRILYPVGNFSAWMKALIAD